MNDRELKEFNELSDLDKEKIIIKLCNTLQDEISLLLEGLEEPKDDFTYTISTGTFKAI